MTRFIRMRFTGILSRTLQFSRTLEVFSKDKGGVSAVEFALLLPLMLTLYLGCTEISQGISIHRKVTLTARTVADLVSRAQTVSDATKADADAALNAAAAILAPNPDGNAKMVVSVVEIDSTGKAKIKWSKAKNGTARAAGSSVTLPATLNVPSTLLVWGEITYNYTPTIGYILTGPMPLSDNIFMSPRNDVAA